MEKSGRPTREHIPNSVHHVIVRGNNKQKIFYGEEQFNYFLNVLSDSTKKFDHKILGYCLMTNHVHLIVHVWESPLSAIMQNINFRYARWSNHRMKRIGHLFQARYCSLVVCNEAYLINLCRYIHLNPVKANMVRAISDYQWSSHIYYKEGHGPAWMELSKVLDAIRHKTSLGYSDFMHQELDSSIWKPALYLSEAGKLIIDDELINTFGKTSDHVKEESRFLTFDEVIDIVCSYLNVVPVELLGSSRARVVSKKRALVVYYVLKYCDIGMTQIAKRFGRTQTTLTRQVKGIAVFRKNYFPSILLNKIEAELEKQLNK